MTSRSEDTELLARKINRSKWDQSSDLATGEINADAVTVDLRTTGNTLSFWRSATSRATDLDGVVLALATGAERLDKFDIAWLAAGSVRQAGLQLADTEGNTPVGHLRERHVDVEKLDLVRLGNVAILLRDAICRSDHKRLGRKAVLDLVVGAVRNGQLQVEDLKPGVRDEVKRALATETKQVGISRTADPQKTAMIRLS